MTVLLFFQNFPGGNYTVDVTPLGIGNASIRTKEVIMVSDDVNTATTKTPTSDDVNTSTTNTPTSDDVNTATTNTPTSDDFNTATTNTPTTEGTIMLHN